MSDAMPNPPPFAPPSSGAAPALAVGEGWWAVVRDVGHPSGMPLAVELHGFDPRGLLAGEIVPAPPGTRLLDAWDGERFSRPTPLAPPHGHFVEMPEPASREVRKLLIVDRLDAGGLLDAAMQALASDPKAKFRWDAAVSVRSDDAQVRALLAAIGADPDEYLAPE